MTLTFKENFKIATNVTLSIHVDDACNMYVQEMFCARVHTEMHLMQHLDCTGHGKITLNIWVTVICSPMHNKCVSCSTVNINN